MTGTEKENIRVKNPMNEQAMHPDEVFTGRERIGSGRWDFRPFAELAEQRDGATDFSSRFGGFDYLNE